MLTIHYSPNSHYPENVPNAYDLIREHGKAWFVDNFPTSGDISTNDFLAIAIVGSRIRNKHCACADVQLIEYTKDNPLGSVVRLSDTGSTIEPLTDNDQYQFEALFCDE